MSHAINPLLSARQRIRFFAHSTRHRFAYACLALLAGCITYTPPELSAMPAINLCEMQLYSRVNLNNETKARLQDELKRRNEDCRQYVAQLEKERADERETAMYNLSGP